jgi:hypothetical protein
VAQSSGAFLAIRRKTTLETTLQNRRNFFLVLAFGAASLLGSIASASAEGLFEALFGRWTGPSAYADPQPQFNPFAGMRSEGAGSVAYCVRVCDGRYFPIQRHGGISPAQACSSFCPASETRIYNGGSSIDHAVSGDGRRYTELNTAFVYRQKIVPGCTCNGRDAFGLVITPVAEDTTLRPGDIVATNRGLMAAAPTRAHRISRRSIPMRGSRPNCAKGSRRPRSRPVRTALRRRLQSSRLK